MDRTGVVTASAVLANPTVLSIEDPLYAVCIPKADFFSAYSKVCEVLDGKPFGAERSVEYFNDYFGVDVIDRSRLRMRNDDERMGFLELARELGDIPDIEAHIKAAELGCSAVDCAPENLVITVSCEEMAWMLSLDQKPNPVHSNSLKDAKARLVATRKQFNYVPTLPK